MLKNLGQQSCAMGFLAGFTGEYIQSEIDRLNITNKFIKTNGLTRINIKINDKNRKETEISGISPIITKDEIEKLLNYISKLTKDDILVLSGSIPKDIDINIYSTISQKTNAKVIIDTRGEHILNNIHNNILVKPNIIELEKAFNVKINDEKEIYTLASRFLDKGVENVLVSMGSKGAILVKKDRYYKANIPKGVYKNSIGAGDSMVAGFIYGYLKKFSDVEILKLAVACGTATAYSYNIGQIELVNKLRKEVVVKEIIYK